MKKILIAGGSSGIGLELVKNLSSRGWNVTCACRSPEKITTSGVDSVLFDAQQSTIPFDAPEVLDGFVYCPGTIHLKPFQRTTDQDFLSDLEINFMGAVRLLRHLIPSLKRGSGSSIVLFSTVAVQTGLPFHASIAAAKGAVEGLTRALAAELAPQIRVNALAPSLTDTPLAAGLLSTDEKRKLSAERHPLNRIGDPSDLAELAAFLLSDASKFITGQIIKVDGGFSSIKPL